MRYLGWAVLAAFLFVALVTVLDAIIGGRKNNGDAR